MPQTDCITIQFNGHALELPAGASIAQMLQATEMAGKIVAVEVDGQIVPRQRHADCVLQHGNVVEAVTLVGGG